MVFKTKPALAVDLLTDLHTAGLLPWATGDEVYGRDKDLRDFCEQHSMGYVFLRYGLVIPLPSEPSAQLGACRLSWQLSPGS